MDSVTPPSSARVVPIAVCLVPIVVVSVAANSMNLLSPALIAAHPVAVIVANANNRYLVAAAATVTPWLFFVVATSRLIVSDPAYFFLGRDHSDTARQWLERRMGMSRSIRWLHEQFERRGPVIVLVAPNAYVSFLAGASTMSGRRFAALNITGTITRVALIWIGAQLARDQIAHIIDGVDQYQRWVIASTFLLLMGHGTITRLRMRPRATRADTTD